MKNLYVTVIGSSANVPSHILKLAYQVGLELGKRGAILVCGGRGGIMETVAKGAKEAGGITIGILPGLTREEANKYIDIAIPTGMGHARNVINVLSGDVVIVIHGGPGTLSEVGLALAYSKPVVVLRGSGGVADLVAGRTIGSSTVYVANSPSEAVKKAIELVEQKKRSDINYSKC